MFYKKIKVNHNPYKKKIDDYYNLENYKLTRALNNYYKQMKKTKKKKKMFSI